MTDHGHGPYSPGQTFPLVDADRSHEDREYQRRTVDAGFIEPRIPELDDWCTMRLRIATSAAGTALEIGPYDLSLEDIYALRDAIDAYLRATGR